MAKEKNKRRKSLIDRLFDMVGDALDGVNKFINRIQDRILDLADTMENRLKGEQSEKKDELKEYMKVSIKDIEESKVEKEAQISVKPIVSINVEELKSNDIKVAEVVKIKDLMKKERVEEPEFIDASQEIDEDDVKKLTVLYGVDREKALKLIENDIKTIFKLASEVPSKISRILDIPVVEAQNIIRAASGMIF